MKKIKQIAAYFGLHVQTQKTIEELSELIRALVRDDKENLIEEIVDVEIMLEQIKHLNEISVDDIKAIKEKKINRTIKKIKGESYEEEA